MGIPNSTGEVPLRSTWGGVVARYVVLGACHMGAMLLALVATRLVTSRFDAAAFGDLTLARSVFEFLALFSSFGTELYAVVKASRASTPEAIGNIAADTMAVRVILGLGAYAATIGAAFLLPQYAGVRGLLCLFGLSVFSTAVTVAWVSQSVHRTHVLALANLGTQLLNVSFLWLALNLQPALSAVPLAKFAAELLIAAGLLVWMTRTVARIPHPSGIVQLVRVIRECAPFAGSQLTRGFALLSDRLLLGLFIAAPGFVGAVTRAELGHFGAAFQLFIAMTAMGSLYFVILLPRFGECTRLGGSALRRELALSLRLALGLAIPIVIALILAAGPLLTMLFGPGYSAASGAFQLMTVAWLLNLVRLHYRQVLLVSGDQYTDFKQTAATTVVHVAAKLVLIPVLGITGAALGSVIGEAGLLFLQHRAAQPLLAGQPTQAEENPIPANDTIEF